MESFRNFLIYVFGILQTFLDYGMPVLQVLISISLLIKVVLDIDKLIRERKRRQKNG